MRVQCPSCSALLNAPDNQAGKAWNCPQCSKLMQLPATSGGMATTVKSGAGGMEIPTTGVGRRLSRSVGGFDGPASAPARPGAGRPAGTPSIGKAPEKPCPYCGETILVAALQCHHCQTWLSGPGAGQSAVPRSAGGPDIQGNVEKGMAALADYHKGMRGMGIALIVLGCLTALCLGVALVPLMAMADKIPGASEIIPVVLTVAVMALVIYVVLGIFALMRHGWVNWVVIAVAGLNFLSSFANMFAASLQSARPNAIGAVFVLLFLMALIATAILNLVKLSAVKAAGLNPRRDDG